MNQKSFRAEYTGSWFFLIMWLILIFPIGIVLFFFKSTFHFPNKSISFRYHGSLFWLCLSLFFLPLFLLLLMMNGVTKIETWDGGGHEIS